MKIKRLLLRIVFSQAQLALIWNAVEFSIYTYRRRGQFDEHDKVKKALNKFKPLFVSEVSEQKDADAPNYERDAHHPI